VLVVAHAGLNRTLLCHWLGMPLQNLFRIDQDLGCLNVIALGDSGYRVHMLNWAVRVTP
jgi:probable phosphoglycerate mutase